MKLTGKSSFGMNFGGDFVLRRRFHPNWAFSISPFSPMDAHGWLSLTRVSISAIIPLVLSVSVSSFFFRHRPCYNLLIIWLLLAGFRLAFYWMHLIHLASTFPSTMSTYDPGLRFSLQRPLCIVSLKQLHSRDHWQQRTLSIHSVDHQSLVAEFLSSQ